MGATLGLLGLLVVVLCVTYLVGGNSTGRW